MKKKKISKIKENALWYSDISGPMRTHSKLTFWKQLKPLYVDKISLLEARGDLSSTKIPLNIRVMVRIQNFYRLSIAKNIQSGKTTSSKATPLGDGRGVPKCFKDFGRFSKKQIAVIQVFGSQPSSLLEGFALRRRLTLSVLKSYNKGGSVSISLIKKGENTVLTHIMADFAKMDPGDPSPAMDLLQLISDADFDTTIEDNIEPGLPEISSEEIDLILQDLGELSPPSLSLPEEHPESEETEESLGESCPAEATPQHETEFSIPAGTSQGILHLRQVGPRSFEVIIPQSENNLAEPKMLQQTSNKVEVLSNISSQTECPSSQYSTSPTSSIYSSSPPRSSSITPKEETREEKRLREQKEACKRYRERKKIKIDEEGREIDYLEKKNRELRTQLKAMEENLEWMRSIVKERIVGKRKREDDVESEAKRRVT